MLQLARASERTPVLVDNSYMKDMHKLHQRLAGWLRARLQEIQPSEEDDPRKKRGRRWKFSSLTSMTVVGLCAGMKSFRQIESLSESLSLGMRRFLDIARTVADTTLRDAMVKTVPDVARRMIHAVVKQARRRKLLEPVGLPFGVAVMDGKSVTLDSWDDHYAVQRVNKETFHSYGLLRTISCCLVSSASAICLDAIPLVGDTNEVGFFQQALTQLLSVYGKGLFRLVSYDAGGCSEDNADFVVAQGLDYFFGIKGNQKGIYETLKRMFAPFKPEQACAKTEDVLSNKQVLTRRIFIFTEKPLFRWSHARTFIRVDSEIRDAKGNIVQQQLPTKKYVDFITRYFISSAETKVMTNAQWLLVVRKHWAVENNLHHTLDTAFKEDRFPFMPSSPIGSLIILLLRRVAYNLIALFRTSAADKNDLPLPWLFFMQNLYVTLVSATEKLLDSLRSPRAVPASP